MFFSLPSFNFGMYLILFHKSNTHISLTTVFSGSAFLFKGKESCAGDQ